MLARTLGVAARRVRVVSGATGPERVVEIEGLTPADVATRLSLG